MMDTEDPAASQAWRQSMQRMNDETAGLLNIDVLSGPLAVDLLVAAAFGGYDSYRIMKAVAETFERVRNTPRNYPALCVCCPRAVRRITAGVLVGVATPAVTGAGSALDLLVCKRCAVDRDRVLDKVRVGLSRLWPDIRPVTVTHSDGGRA